MTLDLIGPVSSPPSSIDAIYSTTSLEFKNRIHIPTFNPFFETIDVPMRRPNLSGRVQIVQISVLRPWIRRR